MKFQVITFGCKVNSYESESLRESLLSQGFEEAKDSSDADLFFVNTCAVTAEAERKDLQKVRSLARRFPEKKIYVFGCSSQIHKEKYLEIPSVCYVTGNSDKRIQVCPELPRDNVDLDSRHFTYQDTPIQEGEKNVRAYVKIQDGCDNFCSYCVVPFTRGNSRSRKRESILKEVETLLESGIKEIILGGIDVGSYQDPENPSYRLTDLLKDLLHFEDYRYRIRVSSIEASQVDDNYIALFRDHQDILCPHFHLPLQSGCEKTLKRMNRKYSLAQFEEKVHQIRQAIPTAALSCDVITGFPGETEEDFKDTYDFCKKIGFMRIHAFPYSERPFTMAAKLSGSVPVPVRMARVKELIDLSEKNEEAYRNTLIGKEQLILIEEKGKDGKYVGYSQNYLRYSFDSQIDLTGQFVKFMM